MFRKVAIIGSGLIGGSLGMALLQRRLTDSVVGVGRRHETMETALRVGAVSSVTLDPVEGVSGADLVVLSTPISAFGAIMERIAPALAPNALLTDVASTKVRVIEVVSAALKARPDVAFISSHPMAGGEQTGPAAARTDLFEGAVCILTPLADTPPECRRQIAGMWEALGAHIVTMSPQQHDRVVARVSHMPHLVAAALVTALEESDMRMCGRGLIDTTRIASGSPDMWTDICDTNREQVRDALKELLRALQAAADDLEHGRLDDIRALLATAKEKRDKLVAERDDCAPPEPQRARRTTKNTKDDKDIH